MTHPNPYGYEFYGKTIRKWQKGSQTLSQEHCPGEGWKQVRLSAWDYSGHKITEFEMLKEVVK